MSPQPARSMNSEPGDLLGRTEPRIWTPPLCELTPETTVGYDVITFARDVLGQPLTPWQEWLMIHAGELLPDGRPRFRRVLAMVARQNGKTHLLRVLTLYWMFVEAQPLILGMSASRSLAKESWDLVNATIQDTPLLKAEHKRTVYAADSEVIELVNGSQYKFAAANRRGGRGRTIDRLILDEVRELRNFEAYDAAMYAMTARPYAQLFAISNQGDADAVVLDSLREPAIRFIESGEGDDRLGLFEWSAPPGAAPDDPEAIVQANPNIGYFISLDDKIREAKAAMDAGGEALAGFKTEVLCQRVTLLDPIIEPELWSRAKGAIIPSEARGRISLCLDVSLDGTHATLAAAAEIDGVTHVWIAGQWDDTAQVFHVVQTLVDQIKPQRLGWFPHGPCAMVAASFKKLRLPRGTKAEALDADLAAVCMGFADAVHTGILRHDDDPLLTAHIMAAQRKARGDAWVFGRRGSSPVDAAYAAAGAVHLARTARPPRPHLAVV